MEKKGVTGPLSVVTVELARFGSVNDSTGAEIGNKIISTVAKRLKKIFTNVALIARTHGDHFCLVLNGDEDLNEQIEMLNDFTQRPLAIRGEIIVLSIRVGVAVLGPAVALPTKLLHAAEVALHRAKRDKIKRCFFYRDLESEAKASHRLENDLRVSLVNNHAELHKAINNNEFYILYQPIVNIATRQVHSMEALIRWNHPQRGIISPAQFIPMAEQIQVMDVLGNWVLRLACKDAVSFPKNADGSQPGISINVSATQFMNPGILLASVNKAMHDSGIDPGLVKLEMTESTALSIDKIFLLNSLKSLGCQIALDDFGTGFSSLTQLNALPLDYLKLDRGFISAIGGDDPIEDQRSERMTRAIIAIANLFDLQPIVEGVESRLQCDRLAKNGARLMQGYFFAKPLALEGACNFVKQYSHTISP